MSFNTTRLVTDIINKGCLPEGRFSTQEILDFAFDCLISEIMPVVIQTRQSFYVTYQDVSVVANQSAYDIPVNAYTGVLREIKLIEGTDIKNLERIELEEITTTQTGNPRWFYIQGNQIILYPTPSTSTGSIRQYYYQTPNKLVPVSEAGIITAISGNDISLTIPSTWSASDEFCIVKGRAHYDVIQADLSASVVGGGVITLTSDISSAVQVGDYVCLNGESCFPHLPKECHVTLIQLAAASLLEATGDPNAQGVAIKAQYLLGKMREVLSTRVVGETNLGKRLM